jgi:hypothetical protein
MRCTFATLLLIAICAHAHADNARLRDLLGLLGGLKTGSSYDTVKAACPALGPMKPDVGEGNTEAVVIVPLGGVEIRGEFNFARGGLVSHGFTSGTLTHAQAHAFFLRCASEGIELYGRGKRDVVLPTENDGPRDQIGIQLNWQDENVTFQLRLAYRHDGAVVAWGAQGVSAK